MSRIPPIALRIACNTRNYDCSGISSYYYTSQLLANFVLIQNVKTLGQQLVFPMNDLKPNDPKLAIQPSLFPVDTILKTHRTWQSKLKNHKSFFNSKTIGFACAFVFDHLNNAISSPKSKNQLGHLCQKKKNHNGDSLSRLQKQTNEYQLNQNVKKNVCILRNFISSSHGKSSFSPQKSTHFNTRSFNKQGDSSFFISKHRCLNLLMLKQIMAMKEFRPTHEIKHDIFYLACTGLVNQGKRLPSPMLAKKEFASSKMQASYLSMPTLSKSLYFESIARQGGKVNRNVSDLRQTIHRGLGIPKCFISRSCDQNAYLHLWHILPYDYIASHHQLTSRKTDVNSIKGAFATFGNVKPISTCNKRVHTFGPKKRDFKENRINHKVKSQVSDVRSLLILFHMYDFEKNRSENNHAHSNMHSACVRF